MPGLFSRGNHLLREIGGGVKLGSQLFHALAEGPWPSYLTSLGPSFLIYKRHTVTVRLQ